MEKRFEVSNLPTEVSVWTKIKNFLFHEVKLELTPKIGRASCRERV